MTENHFRSHFSPFQINMQLFCFSQNGYRRPFWMTENHFRSHFSPFQINMQLFCFSQNGCRRPFWMTENHFRSHVSPFQINTQLLFFSQNGCRRPFWITENHFRSHFSPFHINTQLLYFFSTKWLPATILDDRKSLVIAFLAVSRQYATFIFFHKIAAGGHFGWLKITFDRMYRRFKSIRNFYYLWPKITFDRISRHFTSIHNFYIFLIFSTKWLLATILYDRKSLLIAFLTVSNQYATFFFFSQNRCRRPFWMTENNFRSHVSPFQINTQLLFFHKMAAGGHFGWPKITFDRISRHFTSIHNFYIFLIFFNKMAAGDHFGWPKITFDRISRRFKAICNFYFFHKIAAGGHFGWLKITFDRMYRRFKSIRNFNFFTKWLPATILDDRKSLSIAFLAILHQYTTFIFFWIFPQNGRRRPFWMTENHFRMNFSPFQINTQLLFLFIFFLNGRRPPFWKSLLGHFWMTENHFWSHFSPFQINTQLFFFWIFLYKITILVIQAITTNYIYYRSVRTEEEENVNKLSI